MLESLRMASLVSLKTLSPSSDASKETEDRSWINRAVCDPVRKISESAASEMDRSWYSHNPSKQLINLLSSRVQ